MKTIKEILKLARKKFIEDNYSSGLCLVIYQIQGLSLKEINSYLMYIDKNLVRKTKVFYEGEGKETSRKSAFCWKREDSKARINWLDEQIKLFT